MPTIRADATDDLFRAAQGGTASEVRTALSAGANPGTRNGDGATPFGHARRHDEILRGTDACWRLNEAGFE